MKKFIVSFSDNSVLTMDNKYWLQAIEMKCKAENITLDFFTKVFIKSTENHWQNKTVPSKFDWDDSWEDELQHQLYMERCDILQKQVLKKFENKYGGRVYAWVPKERLESSPKDYNDIKEILETNKTKGYSKVKLNNGNIAFFLAHGSKMAKESDINTSEIIDWADKKVKEPKYQKQIAKKYNDMANLSNTVLYHMIRGFLMGIAFSTFTKGKGGAILLGEKSVTKVNKHGFKKEELE